MGATFYSLNLSTNEFRIIKNRPFSATLINNHLIFSQDGNLYLLEDGSNEGYLVSGEETYYQTFGYFKAPEDHVTIKGNDNTEETLALVFIFS